MDKNSNQLRISLNEHGEKIVVIPQIIFKGKRSIDWNDVERYLKKYIGTIIEIAETKDLIYIGNDFPSEYKGSEHTQSIRKSSRGKIKANLTQVIAEIVAIATNRRWQENKKEKHNKRAKNGWYRYDTRFAMPVINELGEIETLNRYKATIIVNFAENGKLYLYDIQNIKKETSPPTQDI